MKNHKKLFLQRMCYHTLYDVWAQSLWFGDTLDVFARLQSVRKHFGRFFAHFEAYTHQISKSYPKFHFLEHKNAFLCNLQNMQSVVRQNHFLSSKSIKIKSKIFLRLRKLFQNVLRMFLKHKGKNYFLVKKSFSKIFSTSKNLNFTIPYPSHQTLSFKATSSGHRALGKYFCNFWVLVSCLEGPN